MYSLNFVCCIKEFEAFQKSSAEISTPEAPQAKYFSADKNFPYPLLRQDMSLRGDSGKAVKAFQNSHSPKGLNRGPQNESAPLERAYEWEPIVLCPDEMWQIENFD